MKAILLVCLIATSMMVNAIEIPQDQVLSGQTDSPRFLHLKTCPFCCNGVCCASVGNCVKGVCNSILGSSCTTG